MSNNRNGLIIVTVVLGMLAIALSSFADARARRPDARQPDVQRPSVQRIDTARPITAQQSGDVVPPVGGSVFSYSGEPSSLAPNDAPSILNRSYSIVAEVDVPGGGGSGMIVTLGGRLGGYGLYVLKGKPVFTYNFLDRERFKWKSSSALSPGRHRITFDFAYEGGGRGRGGSGLLRVDGQEVAAQWIRHTIPFVMSPDETFDIGMDTRTPVDNDYRVPFRFTGKIDKLTITLSPEQTAAREVRPRTK